ncbi:MAG TPA: DUF1007 family protein [Geminicoccaceae bacterium]|nr:DUF1007 family protein [Geminicoccaceae bacterium]
MKSPFLLAALLASVLLPGAAAAHPHIWIDAKPTLRLEGNLLQAIGMRWEFDELFSDFLLSEFDRDGDGAFDAEETRAVAEEAFAALAEFSWLTHLRVDGAPVALPGFQGLEVTTSNGLVTYAFELPLPAAVDVTASRVVLSLYDDSFYIDVAIDRNDPVALAGSPSAACEVALFEDQDNPIYFGLVNPLAADLRCRVS